MYDFSAAQLLFDRVYVDHYWNSLLVNNVILICDCDESKNILGKISVLLMRIDGFHCVNYLINGW